MDREKKAGELFLEGRNCSQAVFAAFCDATGYSESDALKLASSFGGGIGGARAIPVLFILPALVVM